MLTVSKHDDVVPARVEGVGDTLRRPDRLKQRVGRADQFGLKLPHSMGDVNHSFLEFEGRRFLEEKYPAELPVHSAPPIAERASVASLKVNRSYRDTLSAAFAEKWASLLARLT